MPRYATYHFVKILGSVVISVISPQDLLAKIAIEKSKDTWSSAKAEERSGDLAGCRNRRRQRFGRGVFERDIPSLGRRNSVELRS